MAANCRELASSCAPSCSAPAVTPRGAMSTFAGSPSELHQSRRADTHSRPSPGYTSPHRNTSRSPSHPVAIRSQSPSSVPASCPRWHSPHREFPRHSGPWGRLTATVVPWARAASHPLFTPPPTQRAAALSGTICHSAHRAARAHSFWPAKFREAVWGARIQPRQKRRGAAAAQWAGHC